MKINAQLGYDKVQFAELTDDKDFWKGCSSCINYDILSSTDQKHCLCTGMLYDPEKKKGAAKLTNEEPTLIVKEEKTESTAPIKRKHGVAHPKAFELDEVFC